MLANEVVNVYDEGLACFHGRPGVMENYHRHHGIELNFLERGRLTYLFAGARRTLEAGCLAVFWATLPHRVVEVDGDPIFYYLHVPLSNFLQWQLPANLITAVLGGAITVDRIAGNAAIDRVMFPRWHNDIASGHDGGIFYLEIEARLRRLAVSSTEIAVTEEPGAHSSPALYSASEMGKVASMTLFIIDNYTEEIGVADIAGHVDLHPKYAMKLFRKVLGTTLLAYVTQLRVAHAHRLLATTDIKVVDIAFRSGFGSVNRFYAVFQQSCGKSPTKFRNFLRKDG